MARAKFDDLFDPFIQEVFHPQLLVDETLDDRVCCSPDDVVLMEHPVDGVAPVPVLLEYKCPVTCNVYDTPKTNHYAQVLTGMAILRVKVALIVCWTPTKTRIFVVPFHQHNWQLIYQRANEWMCKHFDNEDIPLRWKPRLGFDDDLKNIKFFDFYDDDGIADVGVAAKCWQILSMCAQFSCEENKKT